MTLLLAAALNVVAARTNATGAGEIPLPRLLSSTGLYRDVTSHAVAPGNRAFSPQYPLWTDGAQKRRWVSLPAGATIDVRDVDAWSFPIGTRFWKEFSFAGRRVETRMLVRSSESNWQFASYVWNEAQTDAELAPAAGLPNAVEVAPGKWHSIPGVDECRACHDSNRTEILGFTALQLSDDRDPEALHADPPSVDALTLRGLVEERRVSPHRADFVSTPPRIPARTPRERAVLGYLSTNCGACHNASSSLASLGLRFRQPAYGGGQGVVSASLARRTKWDRPGSPAETTKVIDTLAPEHSALLVRMRSRRPSSQMPPLGTVLPDQAAIDVVTRWVRDELLVDRVSSR